MSTASRIRRERMTQRQPGTRTLKAAGNASSPTAKLRYAFDTSMARGPSALLGYLGLATLLMILFFAAISLIFSLTDSGNPITAVYQALLHALDSGTVAGDTGNGNIARHRPADLRRHHRLQRLDRRHRHRRSTSA